METVEFLPRPKPIDAIARPSGREFRAAQQRHEERRDDRDEDAICSAEHLPVGGGVG